jgi:hypothetical protein
MSSATSSDDPSSTAGNLSVEASSTLQDAAEEMEDVADSSPSRAPHKEDGLLQCDTEIVGAIFSPPEEAATDVDSWLKVITPSATKRMSAGGNDSLTVFLTDKLDMEAFFQPGLTHQPSHPRDEVYPMTGFNDQNINTLQDVIDLKVLETHVLHDSSFWVECWEALKKANYATWKAIAGQDGQDGVVSQRGIIRYLFMSIALETTYSTWMKECPKVQAPGPWKFTMDLFNSKSLAEGLADIGKKSKSGTALEIQLRLIYARVAENPLFYEKWCASGSGKGFVPFLDGVTPKPHDSSQELLRLLMECFASSLARMTVKALVDAGIMEMTREGAWRSAILCTPKWNPRAQTRHGISIMAASDMKTCSMLDAKAGVMTPCLVCFHLVSSTEPGNYGNHMNTCKKQISCPSSSPCFHLHFLIKLLCYTGSKGARSVCPLATDDKQYLSQTLAACSGSVSTATTPGKATLATFLSVTCQKMPRKSFTDLARVAVDHERKLLVYEKGPFSNLITHAANLKPFSKHYQVLSGFCGEAERVKLVTPVGHTAGKFVLKAPSYTSTNEANVQE